MTSPRDDISHLHSLSGRSLSIDIAIPFRFISPLNQMLSGGITSDRQVEAMAESQETMPFACGEKIYHLMNYHTN